MDFYYYWSAFVAFLLHFSNWSMSVKEDVFLFLFVFLSLSRQFKAAND